ncbi:hypothetical protein BOX15_Mlig027600g1 [Macrostomum lignano]|uniref:25S rRNA (uridine-N(3))-methyltransferase BMT5-like domain-containing protein n=1 Tax=Macrostomum lignano TaxID=282301 RepID=A0A267ETJ1_9PLAT|nr:hypothetical protein BOX15_Mlig027600g1 [Macrostomum lignano]
MAEDQNQGQELQWKKFEYVGTVINKVEYSHTILCLDPLPQPSTIFVFLGEGNFTFSTAFAKLRGSNYDEIVATDISVSKEIKDGWPRRLRLDATKMGETRNVFLEKLFLDQKPSRIVLWFQCPWADKDENGRKYSNQQAFLKKVMAAAAKVQDPGELLLIGLCVDPTLPKNKPTEEKWVTSYGNPKAVAAQNGYECLGADREFVGKMLDGGYEHQFTDPGLNFGKRKILKENRQFATLLFKRQQLHPAQGPHQTQDP